MAPYISKVEAHLKAILDPEFSGTFNTTRKQLPIHMLATSPQKRSGWLAIMLGPAGCP